MSKRLMHLVCGDRGSDSVPVVSPCAQQQGDPPGSHLGHGDDPPPDGRPVPSPSWRCWRDPERDGDNRCAVAAPSAGLGSQLGEVTPLLIPWTLPQLVTSRMGKERWQRGHSGHLFLPCQRRSSHWVTKGQVRRKRRVRGETAKGHGDVSW